MRAVWGGAQATSPRACCPRQWRRKHASGWASCARSEGLASESSAAKGVAPTTFWTKRSTPLPAAPDPAASPVSSSRGLRSAPPCWRPSCTNKEACNAGVACSIFRVNRERFSKDSEHFLRAMLAEDSSLPRAVSQV